MKYFTKLEIHKNGEVKDVIYQIYESESKDPYALTKFLNLGWVSDIDYERDRIRFFLENNLCYSHNFICRQHEEGENVFIKVDLLKVKNDVLALPDAFPTYKQYRRVNEIKEKVLYFDFFAHVRSNKHVLAMIEDKQGNNVVCKVKKNGELEKTDILITSMKTTQHHFDEVLKFVAANSTNYLFTNVRYQFKSGEGPIYILIDDECAQDLWGKKLYKFKEFDNGKLSESTVMLSWEQVQLNLEII